MTDCYNLVLRISWHQPALRAYLTSCLIVHQLMLIRLFASRLISSLRQCSTVDFQCKRGKLLYKRTVSHNGSVSDLYNLAGSQRFHGCALQSRLRSLVRCTMYMVHTPRQMVQQLLLSLARRSEVFERRPV